MLVWVGVGVCPLCVVLRGSLLRLVFGFVCVPMLLFVFLVSWTNRPAPLPIGGLSALGVYPHIVGVGIGFGVLWHSLLFVGFWEYDGVGWLCFYLLFPMPRGW